MCARSLAVRRSRHARWPNTPSGSAAMTASQRSIASRYRCCSARIAPCSTARRGALDRQRAAGRTRAPRRVGGRHRTAIRPERATPQCVIDRAPGGQSSRSIASAVATGRAPELRQGERGMCVGRYLVQRRQQLRLRLARVADRGEEPRHLETDDGAFGIERQCRAVGGDGVRDVADLPAHIADQLQHVGSLGCETLRRLEQRQGAGRDRPRSLGPPRRPAAHHVVRRDPQQLSAAGRASTPRPSATSARISPARARGAPGFVRRASRYRSSASPCRPCRAEQIPEDRHAGRPIGAAQQRATDLRCRPVVQSLRQIVEGHPVGIGTAAVGRPRLRSPGSTT